MTEHDRIDVLLVCLGNICRSPLAEAVMRRQAERCGLAPHFRFASAGTGDWHVGKGADPRSAEVALAHGLDLGAHRARQVTAANAGAWDWRIAMDADNHADLLAMGADPARTLMMRRFEAEGGVAPDVPDPYYGGPDGFERAYLMLRDNADLLLGHIAEREGIAAAA